MPEGRASTGSEARRWTLVRFDDEWRATTSGRELMEADEAVEVQEVVERDHDERAEDLRGWADGERVLWRDLEKNAASEQSRNYAEGYADAMEEVVKSVAERFNLTEGRADG